MSQFNTMKSIAPVLGIELGAGIPALRAPFEALGSLGGITTGDPLARQERARLNNLRGYALLASTEKGAAKMNRARKRQKEYQQLQGNMAASLARLAAASPQTYNQVMAGRQLPQGAVVLGGQPRVDLMEDLAFRMATSPNSIPGGPAQPSVMDLI